MTDSELKVQMTKSPASARRALFDEYCNYVYAVVINKLRNCGTREDMEECVSDVFADVFRSLDSLEPRNEDLKGFIGVVAKRRAIDSYRKLSKNANMTLSIDDDDFNELSSSENVVANTERSEQNALLIQKVRELGEPDSTIIIQQFYYNRSSSEIAKAISMTTAAVHKRSKRAREKLKLMLAEVGISL